MQKWHRRQSASTTVEGGTVDPLVPAGREGIHRTAFVTLENTADRGTLQAQSMPVCIPGST